MVSQFYSPWAALPLASYTEGCTCLSNSSGIIRMHKNRETSTKSLDDDHTIRWIWCQDNYVCWSQLHRVPKWSCATWRSVGNMISVCEWFKWLSFTLQKNQHQFKGNNNGFPEVVLLTISEAKSSSWFPAVSKSMVDMQFFSRQIYPMYPTWHCHGLGSDQHSIRKVTYIQHCLCFWVCFIGLPQIACGTYKRIN